MTFCEHRDWRTMNREKVLYSESDISTVYILVLTLKCGYCDYVKVVTT